MKKTVAEINEKIRSGKAVVMTAEEVAEYLSGLKADAYPDGLGEKDILLTADTVVIADGEVLGKPKARLVIPADCPADPPAR